MLVALAAQAFSPPSASACRWHSRRAAFPRATEGAEPPGLSVGIDLGTTSSAIAVVRDGKPEVIADDSGRRSLASRVSFAPDGTARVGEAAGPQAISSAKRLIGLTHEEVAATPRARALFAQQLTVLPNGGAGLRCPASGNVCAPEDVAARVLETLLARAESACGVRAERAVIGVPAHFTQPQREATRAAANAAGLQKVRLLEEPVAAALAYGLSGGADGGAPKEAEELVCVFDLGGGTLDVSLLDVGGGTIEVLSSSGESWLGGDDFDAAVAAHLAEAHGLSTHSRRAPSAELMRVARGLKERLTVARDASLPLPPVLLPPTQAATDGRSADATEVEAASGINATLSRKQLEATCATLLEQMKQPVMRAAAQAQVPLPGILGEGLGEAQAAAAAAARRAAASRAPRGSPKLKGRRVQRVLLVGAASRMPAVSAELYALTDVRPAVTAAVPPEYAVALGAAVQAAILDGSIEQLDVFNVMEAALLRGLAQGPAPTQRQKKGGGPGRGTRRRRR